MNCGHPGGNQVRGIGVTEGVRSGPHIQPRGVPVQCDEKLNGPNGEMTAPAVLEERGLRGLRKAELIVESEDLADTFLGHLIERDNPAARALTDGGGEMKVVAGLAIMGDEPASEALP